MNVERILPWLVGAAVVLLAAFTVWLIVADVPPHTSIPDWLFPPAQESRP